MKSALAIIILLNLFTFSKPEPYKIQPLNITSGIFYHQIGTARITHDQFTLLAFTNISIYEDKLKITSKMYQLSIPLCKNFKIKNNKTINSLEFTCKETVELLDNNLRKLNEKFDSICHLTGHNIDNLKSGYRTKRGLINGVSYAFKWLFGIPDAEDAQYYTEAIESMAKENHDMQVLMKHQIHIVSDAIADHNKTALALKFNEEKLNENIIKFNKFSSSSAKRVNSLTYAQTVTDHFNLVTQLVNELNEEFDEIISAILFSKQGIIHPSIITPRHLRDELAKVKINSQLEFPYNLDNLNNAYKYIEICSLSVVYSNRILIYAIKVPLVIKNIFEIYNLIPIPTLTTKPNIYSYINPSIPYLLLSVTRSYYSEVTDLSKCQKSPPEEFICPNLIVHLISERPTCETDLKMSNPKTIPSRCETKTIKSEVEIWHPLSSNQWLFIMSHPVSGTINCETMDRKIYDITLQKTGIFTLQSKCKCYTLTTLLTATSNLTSNFTNYIPQIDISNDDCCLEKQQFLNQEDMEPIKLTNLNLNELRHAQDKLQQFDEELTQKINQPFIVRISKWYNAMFGIIATIFAIFLVCWCCCRKCRWIPMRWLKRIFCSNGCSSIVCINSHNSIRHSSLGSSSYIDPPSIPMSRRPQMPLPREVREPTYAELNHDYEEPTHMLNPKFTFQEAKKFKI